MLFTFTFCCDILWIIAAIGFSDPIYRIVELPAPHENGSHGLRVKGFFTERFIRRLLWLPKFIF